MSGAPSFKAWVAGLLATVVAGVVVAVVVDEYRRSRAASDAPDAGQVSQPEDRGDGDVDLDADSGTEPGTEPGTGTATDDTDSEPPATRIEALAGDWVLLSWQEAGGPVTLGMEPISGTMTVADDGTMRWVLPVDDLFSDDSGLPQAAVTCEGVLPLTGDLRATLRDEKDYTRNMASLRTDIAAAFCGGSVTEPDHPFAVELAPPDAPTTLQLANDLGTFVWRRA